MSMNVNDAESVDIPIDLPYWIFDEYPSSLKDEKSSILSPTKEKENLQIVKNAEKNESIFTYHYIGFFEQKFMSEQNSELLISNATSRVENLNNIMGVLKMYATKAEKEHDYISSHFENMKTQIKKQEAILDENMDQINNLKERVKEADSNSVHQNTTIQNLGNELGKNKEKLLKAENKLKGITEKLSSSLFPKSSDDLEQINESDEDYVFIINHIREMKVKIEQQENHLANILQLINKLDELHGVNKAIDRQNKTIIHLKDGLRRKSANLFENLKNMVGQSSESTFFDDTAESENLEEFDQSLNTIEQNTRSFFEDVNTKFALLENKQRHPKEVLHLRISDILKPLNLRAIQNSTQKLNNSVSLGQEDAGSSSTRANIVATFEKGIQATIPVESIDASCQTTGSVDENNVSSVQKTLENFNSVQMRYGRMKETLNAYKLDKIEAQKPSGKSIDDLEKEINALSSQVEEKDSKIDSLTKELQLLENLKKENVDLKEALGTSKGENNNLKDQLSKANLSEQDKIKKIAELEKDFIVLKQSHEHNIAFLKKEADSMSKDFILLNQKLTTEKENMKNVKHHYKIVNHNLEQQIKTHEKTLSDYKLDNEMLRNTYEALDRRFKNANTEMENTLKKKDETILLYKLANKEKSTEIKNLKEEVHMQKLSILAQGEKEKYSRTALRENLQCRRSNLKENDANSQQALLRNYPHLQSNITYRARSSERKK